MISMRATRTPNQYEFDGLIEASSFKDNEKAYFADMQYRRDMHFGDDDYEGKIAFYMKELDFVRGKFDGRLAVYSRLKFFIGQCYKELGEHSLKNRDFEKGAEMFEQAAMWYQDAYDTFGFIMTFIASEQASVHFLAAQCIRDAGLNRNWADFNDEYGKRLNDINDGTFNEIDEKNKNAMRYTH